MRFPEEMDKSLVKVIDILHSDKKSIYASESLTFFNQPANFRSHVSQDVHKRKASRSYSAKSEIAGSHKLTKNIKIELQAHFQFHNLKLHGFHILSFSSFIR